MHTGEEMLGIKGFSCDGNTHFVPCSPAFRKYTLPLQGKRPTLLVAGGVFPTAIFNLIFSYSLIPS